MQGSLACPGKSGVNWKEKRRSSAERPNPSPPRATSPFPPHPSTPYPTPMPTRTRSPVIVVPAEAGTSTLSASNLRLACLVCLCRNRTFSRRGPRPTYGPRPRRYDLSAFFGLFNPSNRPLDPSSGPCLAHTPCFTLSTCPSRLKPKLHRVAPGRTSRRKTLRTIQFNSNRPSAPPPPCRLGYLKPEWHNGRAVTNPPRRVSRRTE